MPWFVHPWALLGLGLASAPIVIHLLNRRRFKIVEWAAMEFLLLSNRRNYRRIRIEQLILLALRVLLIVLLILLVSRPLVRRAVAGLAERARLVALVLDTSMSMGYREGTTSSYDRGIAFAEQLMGSLGRGDTWALVVAAGAGRKVTDEASFELEAARAAVARDRLPLSDADSNVPGALAALEEVLDGSRTESKELYIVTDMQRASWLPRTGAVAAEHVDRLKRLSRSAASVTLVDVGSGEPANLAVTALTAESPLAVVGGETLVRARVSNFGSSDAAGVRLDFFVDGFKQQTSPPRDVPSMGAAQWEFRHSFRQAGAHAVMAALEPDALARDDRRLLAVDVRDSVRVLLVDGEPGADAYTGETDFLRTVLRPARSEGEQEVSGYQPEVVAADALQPAELPRYDAVVLANVASLGEGAAEATERYVAEGGALLVFLGDQVDRDFYNRRLHRGGKGPLPCEVGEPMGDAADRSRAVHIEPKVGDHPFVRFFREQKRVLLHSPFFFRHHRLGVDARRDDVRVVCRFDGGSPAVVEGRSGKGRVVVFASTADDEWNDMPSWPMFQPLVLEILAQVARDPGASRNLSVGEPLVRHLSPRLVGAPVRLLRPGESKPLALQAATSQGLVAVTYERTDRAGIYELTVEAEAPAEGGDLLERRHDLFAVNVRPRESDLRRLSQEGLRQAFPGFEFGYQRGAGPRVEAARASEAGELWRALAYALLGLALVESVLAQRFGR